MVVIAAAVTTKTGKVVVSRQYVEISRGKIEGMLASFPKLINSEKEHTFVETDTVRYIYQPMENLYMLLVSTKSSNIMEDLDTLHLMAKLVTEYCKAPSEAHVKKYAFELCFALDEVVAAGYREKLTLQNVRTLIEMDSHEERIHEIVERNRIREATEQAKIRQKEIERERTEMARKPMASMSYADPYHSTPSSVTSSASQAASSAYKSNSRENVNKAKAPSRGMQLSKASKSQDILKQLEAAGEIVEDTSAKVSVSAQISESKSAVQREKIHIDIDEKITLSTIQDGTVNSMEVKGELSLEISDPSVAKILVGLPRDGVKKSLQFRTHPHIDKNRFNSQNVLALKNVDKAFPVNTALNILKWRFVSQNEDDAPFIVSCWPSPGADVLTVNMEYELRNESLELLDVDVAIPIPSGNTPVVESVDGEYNYQARSNELHWTIPVVDASSSTGSMEFTIPYSGSSSSLFPITVQFRSTTTLSGIQIGNVLDAQSNQPVTFSSHVMFSPDGETYRVDSN